MRGFRNGLRALVGAPIVCGRKHRPLFGRWFSGERIGDVVGGVGSTDRQAVRVHLDVHAMALMQIAQGGDIVGKAHGQMLAPTADGDARYEFAPTGLEYAWDNYPGDGSSRPFGRCCLTSSTARLP